MRTAAIWTLGIVHAAAWLGWYALAGAPVWWLGAAVTSAVIVVVGASVLHRRDLVAIALSAGAGVAVGWSAAVMPDDAGIGVTVVAVAVFVGSALAASVIAGGLFTLRERRAAA